MASNPRILIITGYGVNCEAESQAAWEMAGATASLVHLKDLLAQPKLLHDHQALMFIGGFSYGDHMNSGHVFAARIRHHLREDLQRFIEKGHLVLGICNGFQVMVKLGLLPGLDHDFFNPKVALIQNDCATFQNYWVRLSLEGKAADIYFKDLTDLEVPIRHGEGRLFTLDKTVLQRMEDEGCVACRYLDPSTGKPTLSPPHNPNGSLNAIAGLCDPTGRILGMMPHPEAFLFPENHPTWDAQRLSGNLPKHGVGLKLFENAVRHMRG